MLRAFREELAADEPQQETVATDDEIGRRRLRLHCAGDLANTICTVDPDQVDHAAVERAELQLLDRGVSRLAGIAELVARIEASNADMIREMHASIPRAIDAAFVSACSPGGHITRAIDAACLPGGSIRVMTEEVVNASEARALVRAHNSRFVRLDRSDTLRGVSDLAGNIPANFPQTFGGFVELNTVETISLMRGYGLDTTMSPTLRQRTLAEFIGLNFSSGEA